MTVAMTTTDHRRRYQSRPDIEAEIIDAYDRMVGLENQLIATRFQLRRAMEDVIRHGTDLVAAESRIRELEGELSWAIRIRGTR